MKINLVSRDNGVGLSKDMDLLESIFVPAGHDVQRVEWRSPSMRRCDIAIYLELFNPRLMTYARRHIGVFNLEWFVPRWRPWLPRFRQLWAKSLECYETFGRLRLGNVHHTGFLGADMHDPDVPRELRCLHLAGHSSLKNTDDVLSAWRHDPDLPPLTIITARAVAGDIPPHVEVRHGYVSPEELRREMNRATIHVCPSAAEGWGHYITEGLSVGALVVATDASPMNEHVRPEHGVLVPPAATGKHGVAARHYVSPDAIIKAVRYAATLDPDRRAAMGAAAREHLLARNERFRATALDLIRRAA